MRPVLELHLAGQTTPDIQVALSAHLPTCAECLSVVQAYAQAPAAYPPDPYARPPDPYPPAPRADSQPTDPRAAVAADPRHAAYPTSYPAGPPADPRGPRPPEPAYPGDPRAAYPAAPRAPAPHPGFAAQEPLIAMPIEPGASSYLTEEELRRQLEAAAAGVPATSAPPDVPADEVDGVLPRPVRAMLELIGYGLLGLLVMIAVVAMPDLLAPPEVPTTTRAPVGAKLTDVRLTRVRPSGARERMLSNLIAPDDRLAFSFIHTADWERLMIVVLDEHGQTYWQYPDWADRRQPAYAPTILSKRDLQTIPIATHRDWAGKLLTVYVIFSRDFLTTREVEARLTDPDRDRAKPLFSNTLERTIIVRVDPDAAGVSGVPQDETDEFGPLPQVEPERVDPAR